MLELTIYKSSRTDYLECVSYFGNRQILRTYAKQDPAEPVHVDADTVHLVSYYDLNQTLIPNVSKRYLQYANHDINFAEIQWLGNRVYRIVFPDDEVVQIKLKRKAFVIRNNAGEIGTIVQDNSGKMVADGGYHCTAVFHVSVADNISQQALYVLLSFPFLHFGL